MSGELGPGDRALAAAANVLALRSLRDQLGLGRVERAVCRSRPDRSAGARVLLGARNPGVRIYGQTENTAVCT